MAPRAMAATCSPIRAGAMSANRHGGKTSMAENSVLNHTGLSDAECQEVHSYFMKGATVWGVTALIAHLMVYSWLPWFPG
jgi:light-harvesting complex 1 beta chain